jgi:hypothetical protein
VSCSRIRSPLEGSCRTVGFEKISRLVSVVNESGIRYSRYGDKSFSFYSLAYGRDKADEAGHVPSLMIGFPSTKVICLRT